MCSGRLYIGYITSYKSQHSSPCIGIGVVIVLIMDTPPVCIWGKDGPLEDLEMGFPSPSTSGAGDTGDPRGGDATGDRAGGLGDEIIHLVSEPVLGWR